jgi:hypothetical protein
MRTRVMLCVFAITLTTAVSVAAQNLTDLDGRWVRETVVGPGMEGVQPAWEQLQIQGATVTLKRSDQPNVTETYAVDNALRPVTRVSGDGRVCRATWESSTFVIDCVAMPGGPGGMPVPAVETREVRQVGADGRLTVTSNWTNGSQHTTRQTVYLRGEAQ